MLSILFLVKYVLGRSYVNLLIFLANTSREICLVSLSNISLRSTNPNRTKTTAIVNARSEFFHRIKKYIEFINTIWPCNKNIIPKSLPTDSSWSIFYRFKAQILDVIIAIRLWHMRILCSTVTLVKCFLLEIEFLHSKQYLRASTMQAIDGKWSCQASRILIISKLSSLNSDAKVVLLLKLSIVVSI